MDFVSSLTNDVHPNRRNSKFSFEKFENFSLFWIRKNFRQCRERLQQSNQETSRPSQNERFYVSSIEPDIVIVNAWWLDGNSAGGSLPQCNFVCEWKWHNCTIDVDVDVDAAKEAKAGGYKSNQRQYLCTKRYFWTQYRHRFKWQKWTKIDLETKNLSRWSKESLRKVCDCFLPSLRLDFNLSIWIQQFWYQT